MFFDPLLVVANTFLPSLGVLNQAFLFFTFNHQLNRVVYQL
jgi:hypothetical protein